MNAQLREALAALTNEAKRANKTALREFGVGLIDVNVIARADAALSAPAEQAPADDREAAEWHYTVSAFDIGAFPVGSRDWSLFFSGWSASRSHYASPSAPTAVQPADESMEDPVLVPRGLLGAACSAIDKKRDAPTILAKLRAITMSAAAPTAVKEAGGVEAWEHLKPYGYAPGNYMSRCHACCESFAMDKRAITCRRCAEQLAARAAQPATPVAPKTLEALTDVDAFLGEVRAELVRARTKFPGDRIMTIALAEEFGELCKAVLDESAANVRKEAVQTAVMAARVVLDGDGSVREWRAERGLDALATKNGLTMVGGDD